jgi:hypothetical protein
VESSHSSDFEDWPFGRCPATQVPWESPNENEASEGMAAKKTEQNKWWLNIFRDVFCSISGQFHSR